LHGRNGCENWCSVEILLVMWKTGSAFGYQNGRAHLRTVCRSGLALPAGGCLREPGFREAQIARGAEDEMVIHGNVQEPPGVDQLASDTAVVRAGRGVAAPVV
jgi:hypothetical protein